MIYVYLILAGLLVALVALIPVFQVVSFIYPYAYTNARLRSRSKYLVDKETFETLLDRPYHEIIYYLEKNSRLDLSKFLQGDFSYGSVDKALRSELIRDLAVVKKASPQNTIKYLDIILAKYDIQLIESLVRSTNTSRAQKDDFTHISKLVSKEFLDRKEISFEALRNELKGTIYFPLLDKYSSELKKKSFSNFEKELDLIFFKRLLSASKSADAKKYAKALIDNHNLAVALKGEKPIIEGGKIKLAEYEDLQEDSLNKLLKKKGISTNYNTVSQAERNIQLSLLKLGNSLFRKNPLSDSTIIGYIIMKTINIRNLNILLKMKKEGFSRDEIREVLAI